MKSVLIRLEGPMQSWGTQGRFSIRDSDTEPSKSGVIGLVGAALGMSRDDGAMLAKLASLEMAARIDRPGTLIRDYHTAGGGKFRGEAHKVYGVKSTVLTHRYYLSDASFLIALGGDDHVLMDRIAEALRDPVWPLFLGRRSCVPCVSPFCSIRDLGPVEALRAEPLPPDIQMPVRLVVECSLESDGVPRNDVPISFALYERRHARRFVRTEWIVTGEVR